MIARFAAALLFGTLILTGALRPSHANDAMFPPAAAAKSSIDFDGRGFLLHGRRTPLISAGMEYARVPHALWRDRLQRLARAGFNCVEVYTFWNWHEPREGVFDFAGDHDLGAFLSLVHADGALRHRPCRAVLLRRVGQRRLPGLAALQARRRRAQDDAPFLAAVDRFWDRLIPIVAANQINRGGAVVMVQLENEHPQGWGTEMPNAYFTHLRDKALSLGLQVPYFFSGLHHGCDPAGDHPWDSVGRANPWFSTEFWSVWYDHYGPRAEDADTYERRTWKIWAYGGNGYNYYMAHGGSDFGYTNNNEDAASYDYGAAVGEAGDLQTDLLSVQAHRLVRACVPGHPGRQRQRRRRVPERCDRPRRAGDGAPESGGQHALPGQPRPCLNHDARERRKWAGRP